MDKWDTTKLWRLVHHLERTLLKRELTGDEIRICYGVYYASDDGWKKTRQRIRRELARLWSDNPELRPNGAARPH